LLSRTERNAAVGRLGPELLSRMERNAEVSRLIAGLLSRMERNAAVGRLSPELLSRTERDAAVGRLGPKSFFFVGSFSRMQLWPSWAENGRMQIFHLTISSIDRSALFIDEAARRCAVRSVVRVAGAALILFCVVDDHVHVVIVCLRERLPRMRAGLLRALEASSGARLASHASAVENRAHLNRLVAYVLGQTDHHGVGGHPATWSGSCYWDLVGARLLAQLGERARIVLPRLREGDLHRLVGLPPERVTPANDEDVWRAGVDRIVRSAALVFAADAELTDRSTPTVLARRAAVHLADEVGVPRADIVRALELTRQRVGQLAHERVEASALRAIRLQLTIAQLVREQAVRVAVGAAG
jgi:hypothetical protein